MTLMVAGCAMGKLAQHEKVYKEEKKEGKDDGRSLGTYNPRD